MKTAIIYKSYLGATRQYAEWLEKEIKADVFRYEQVEEGILEKYDRLIIMSGTYAGNMPLTKFLTQDWEKIKNKKIIAIAVGGEAPDQKGSIEAYKKIPKEIRDNIKYYKIQGKFFVFPTGGIKKENLNEIIEFLKK